MARKIFWFGILATVLVFGMAVVGCKNVDKELNGTWKPDTPGSVFIIEYEDGEFEMSQNGLSYLKGTYTTKDNNLVSKITHYGDYVLYDLFNYTGNMLSSKWHTRDELIKLVGVSGFDLDGWITMIPLTYSINADSLTTSWESGQSTSTRISRSTGISKTTGSNRTNSSPQTNSPTASAKAWIQAFEKGDATALGRISTPESAVRTSRYMTVMQAQLASNPVQSYSEKISANGNTAVVTVTFKNNSTDTIELVKTDGKWLVSE